MTNKELYIKILNHLETLSIQNNLNQEDLIKAVACVTGSLMKASGVTSVEDEETLLKLIQKKSNWRIS